MPILEKTPEVNRIYVLSELEKYLEHKGSLISGSYKNVDEFIAHKKLIKNLCDDECPPRLNRGDYNNYSKFKVVNCFKVRKKDGMDTSPRFKTNSTDDLKKIQYCR